MKTSRLLTLMVFVITITLAFGSSQALAVGTPAGTDVDNTAEVSFTILGATTSVFNSATFKVDEKIRPVVANTDTGNQVAVLPDTVDNVLTFTITNESNTTAVNDWFEITVDDEGTGTLALYNVAIYQDTDATPGFSGSDTAVADGGWVQISNASGSNSETFFVIADIRDTATAGQLNTLHLVAEAVADGSGTDLTADVDATNDPTASETYFADDAGSGTAVNNSGGDDVASDAFHSASGTFVVQTPIVISKAVSNGANTGYQIPGDIVTYTITVNNNHATDSATLVTIYDAIPTYTTYNAGSLNCSDASFTEEWSSDVGAPSTWVSAEPGTVNHVRCKDGTINSGASASMTFEAFID